MAFQFEKSGAVKTMTAEELAAADNDTSLIVYNSGMTVDGRTYWAYIAIKPSKYQEFMRASATHQAISATEYGTVLKFGFESEVPANIKEEMKKKYGCDDEYLAALVKKVREAQIEFLKGQETQQLDDIVAMLKKKQPNGG